MRFHPGYALATAFVFVTEILIALYIHDAVIRPYVGDSLAVILVYLALRAVTSLRVSPAAVLALAIAFAIEFGQLFHLIDALGLRGNRIAGFILGGYFDVTDLAAYAAGGLMILITEKLRQSFWRDEKRKIFSRYLVPVLLIALAIIVLIRALNFPSMVAKDVSTVLIAGSSHTIDFTAAYDSSYTISVEMDQKQAKRLFPCTTDPVRFSPDCKEVFPVDMELKLSANGTDISSDIRRASPGAGGQYGGHDTFLREVGYVPLQRGKSYRLTWTCLKDGTVLTSAHPRLVVDATSQLSETNMIRQLAALILSITLALVSGIWALVTYLRRPKPDFI